MKLRFAAVSVCACLILIISIWAIRAVAGNAPAIHLIPAPLKFERQRGTFQLRANTKIVIPPPAQPTAQWLADRVRKAAGYDLQIVTSSQPKTLSNAIILELLPASGSDAESYELVVNPKSVIIKASAPAGLLYGTETLLQLFPRQIFGSRPPVSVEWTAPCLRIQDRPRFRWRGVLLDVARHFFTPAELKRYIDEIALHKMNVLQLHLTDDNGWRVEIKGRPRLTEVGAWRKSIGFDLPPNSSTAYGPDGRYGGFYTQAELGDLVAYAGSRNITLLPEIEMPGHASAALAAYPNLSCSGGPYSTDMSGAAAGVFCASNEDTYKFIDGVLTEVAELFPGKYIHIGGDEVTKENWHGCEKCQALMKQEGLKNEHELQSYFVRRVEKIVNSKGRSLIGWSEIREGGLAANATVMDWIGGAVEAASAGHDVIMSPTTHCYLDYYQSRNRTNEPPAIGAFLPLKTVYSFEPVPAGLPEEQRAHILGAQGNVWTEYIANLKHVEYMTFPRLCALSEVTWSDPKLRDWDNFVQRLQSHVGRLEAAGINYRKGFFEQ